MTHVVTENCINCKHGSCVDVCPVDAFREGPNFLVIAPDDCIDCHLCVSECPVEAIHDLESVPEAQQVFIPLNALLANVWPELSEGGDPLPNAHEWSGKPDKREFLVLPREVSSALDAWRTPRSLDSGSTATELDLHHE